MVTVHDVHEHVRRMSDDTGSQVSRHRSLSYGNQVVTVKPVSLPGPPCGAASFGYEQDESVIADEMDISGSHTDHLWQNFHDKVPSATVSTWTRQMLLRVVNVIMAPRTSAPQSYWHSLEKGG